jgi:urease accessory protein UreE
MLLRGDQGKLVRYQPRQGRYKIKLQDGKDVEISLPHNSVKFLLDGDAGAAIEQSRSSKRDRK